MQFKDFRFDRREFSGSLGDMGTLVPLSIAMIVVNGLNATAVFLMVGLFYIGTGIYFRLPLPVQPLKVVAAIAIATHMDASTIAASGILFGVSLMILGLTGLIDKLARYFTKPIVRGIQLGLGLILLQKAIIFITAEDLLINVEALPTFPSHITLSTNLAIGIVGVLLALLLIQSRRLPAAIAVLSYGIIVSLALGSVYNIREFSMGFIPFSLYSPTKTTLVDAFFLLVIPQIPLTLGNAVIATSDAARHFFGEERAKKASFKALASSMGVANIIAGAISAMPMCHGSGGLAAHYRFGARTGGSNIIIGTIFIIIAVVFGKMAVALLSLIPNSILGILLFYAGIELAMLVRDIKTKNDFFIVFSIAAIALATSNMGIAFIAGIIFKFILDRTGIEL
jgi:SulP family sulfate permease